MSKKQFDQNSADLVLKNGKLLTMDTARPQAEALAVRDDTIIAVGCAAEVEPCIASRTKVIDLAGRLAVPGIIEGHGHYMSLGESLMGLDLRPTRSWQEIVDLVAGAVRTAEPGAWIVGRGWHQAKWDDRPSPNSDGFPVHHRLSEISPDNPVILIHASGHGVFVNALALEQSAIYPNTANPIGGEIVRDSHGNPSGMLRETAQDPAREALAKNRARRPVEVIEADLGRQVELAAQEALANGITSFHDMGETFQTIDFYRKLANEGNLPLRLYVCVQEPSDVMRDQLAGYRMVGYGNNYLTVRAIGEKVLDGALGVHGGWLLEPYADMPLSSGFNVVPVAEIRRSAELAIQNGYQMAIQGIGDRAARELLDIYERNFSLNPSRNDRRWRIEHCQVIHPDDLLRFAKLNVIASIRGVFATSDGPWVVNRLGHKRARERGYLYRTLMESGITVINGTDPPVEGISPLENIYRSITRRMENGELFFPEQRLTRRQVLETYTVNNAYAAFEEDIKGSLTPGKLADITIFNRDIMTIPAEDILNTRIAYTIIGGKVKYPRI
ncbi:MAG: amidohydrolase [bacterium]|nr:amidohydrolase [bacterium]